MDHHCLHSPILFDKGRGSGDNRIPLNPFHQPFPLNYVSTTFVFLVFSADSLCSI